MSKNSFVAYIGLDWADKKHDFCLLKNGHTKCEYGSFVHTPATINEWAMSLYRRFNGRQVALCLELKSGPIVSALLRHSFFTLFFVPPKGLAKYREIFCQSGAKDDPTDAFLQLDYLRKHPEMLRKVTVDDDDTRIIQQLTEHRKKFIDDKVGHTNHILASLKTYYPLALQLFDDLDTLLFCAFIKRWPNLTKLKNARKSTLIAFFKSNHCGRSNVINRRLALITAAEPLTNDDGTIIPQQLYTQNLIRQLEVSLITIKEYDKQIAIWFGQHKDKELFASLPGAGEALAPRLLAAFGSDRNRFDTANEFLNFAGISPVTSRSGEKCWVHWRYKCSTFIRQTFVEWAYQTVKKSYWAKNYYDEKRAQGKSHQAVLRALAFKWIRILFRCWKNHTKYDEATYLFKLDKRHRELSN